MSISSFVFISCMHTIHCLGQRVPEVDHVNPDCNGLFQNQYLLSLAAQMARIWLERSGTESSELVQKVI